MQKKIEETVVFFVTFLSLVAFQFGGMAPWASPPSYAYVLSVKKLIVLANSDFSELANPLY